MTQKTEWGMTGDTYKSANGRTKINGETLQQNDPS
jgi:hypothetical protein